MTEEKKEKPDWLNDFQNNQATSGKQTHGEGENNGITLDIYDPAITYVSPRYGRRSITGVKSVENSPKKGSFHESKSISARSSSARPALLNINNTQSSYDYEENETAEKLISYLRISEDFVKNLSFDDYSVSLENVNRPGFENSLQPLEDSWNSLNVFKIKHKGRLGSNENISVKKIDNSYEGHKVEPENILKRNESSTYNKNSESRQITEYFGETIRIYENGTGSKVNPSKSDTKDFIIPELPQGKYLVFNIKTTWGDKHYLGLNGIEIFNSKGKKVQVKSISADPSNINILPEYSRDPRVVENLIDDVYLTQDDMHMWLAPFTANSSHLIFIEFYEVEELAMLRVWNYNKSRIHCFRGAKDVEIKLDNEFIFIGEIARASGEILNTLNCLGDTILFTTDDTILELVSENDEYFIYNTLSHLEDDQTAQEEFRPLTGGKNKKELRPFTCSKKTSSNNAASKHVSHWEENISDKLFSEEECLQTTGCDSLSEFSSSFRETSQLENCSFDVIKTKDALLYVNSDSKWEENTSGAVTDGREQAQLVLDLLKPEINEVDNHVTDEKPKLSDKNYSLYIPSASFLSSDSAYETLSMPTGYNFTIQIHSTWGDLYYVGLNGLQIFDENNLEIKILPNNITADPESVNVLDEIENDARTPDKLIDGINDSVDAYHMWLAPVLPLTINRIDLTFQSPVTLSSLKLWNYAKTPSRGVREFGILVDGLLIYNGELEQAVVSPGLPRVPCKTVSFSNKHRFQNNKYSINQRDETSRGPLHSADQSQRPLTTMTNNS